MKASPPNKDFEGLLSYLKHNRGFDFTGYKRPTLIRRISKRMSEVRVKSFDDYLDYLEVHSEEFAFLFNCILINVTSFFRDPQAWEFLSHEIIPKFLRKKAKDEQVRVLCAGCATGEEAYTMAMVLCEAMGIEEFRKRTKIYATDIDEEALSFARQANYNAKDLESMPGTLKQKYFELHGNRYVFKNDLRRSVIFGKHDLVQDTPISRLDIALCRNTLMYFNSETQGRIVARLHFALNDPGFLFLGKAENISMYADLFTPINLKHRIFAKVPKTNLRERMIIMKQGGSSNLVVHSENVARIRDLTLETAPDVVMVVDRSSKVIILNEQARRVFSLTPKDIGKSLQDLELSYRPVELRSRIEEAYREKKIVTVKGVQRELSSGATQYFELKIVPMPDNGKGFIGASIIFRDATKEKELEEELHVSHMGLETANEELQSTNEELETTNEELQSTNEELETTNEELQSTNSELETMNEELQAANEELQTTNEELRIRSDELNVLNAFLESILGEMQLAGIVIDKKYNVLIWNHKAQDLWGLRSDEVEGQSIFNLDISLPVSELKDPIRSILSEESNYREMSLQTSNRRGKPILCRVTCSPLRDQDKKVNGVILLMEETPKPEKIALNSPAQS